MLFSTMCWLFCYGFRIILDKIVHHISNDITVQNHLHTFIINDIISLDLFLAHSISITLCKFVTKTTRRPNIGMYGASLMIIHQGCYNLNNN